MGVLILLLTTAAVVPLGAQVLTRTGLAPRQVPERFLMSAALGFVLLAYALLGLGLLGKLTPWWTATAVAAAALLGLGQWWLVGEAAFRAVNALLRALRSRNHALGAMFLVLLCGATFVTALEPPTGRDFDGLAEHLAQAGTYVRHARVMPLWFDHHSHFPATLQMLYTIGLNFHSISGAKLFHWFHGLLALGAVIVLTRRFLARGASGWAGYVFATTPMLLWLAGLSYVDLAPLAYGLLAVHAYLRWRRAGRPADLWLMALMAGCGMTTKMQGIALYGILMLAALFVLLRPRLRPPDLDSEPRLPLARHLWHWVGAGAAALVLACPWYIKSTVNTGNPFYPFAYGLFGGKHWSADRAAGYDRHQLDFGLGELPPPETMAQLPRWRQRFVGPREPWKWLAAPVTLTFLPWEFEVKLGNFQNILLTSTGPLYLALLGALLLLAGRPAAVHRLLWLFLPLWLWWFWSMQLARYLFPSLALLAPVAGYAAYRCWHGGPLLQRALLAAVALWSVVVCYTAVSLAAPALPVVLGQESREQYLLATNDVYTPSLYISRYLPTNAKIGTYGEVRCFYFDRDYMWCEPGHSDLIAYDQMRKPTDLIRRYQELGLTHILINQKFLPGLWDSPDPVFRLLRGAMDTGLLVPVTDFPTHPEYMLFAIRPPAAARQP